MATSILTAFNAYYGYAGSASFSSSAANHMYVGGQSSSSTYNYRSRLTFKPLSSISAIGSNRIKINKMLLYLHRNDGGPSTITIGCSSSSAWDATLHVTKKATIDDDSKWYSVDISNMATAISEYKNNWYIHLRNGTPRLRLSGTGSDYVAYLKIAWEYVAATITSDTEDAELGSELHFIISPEVSDEIHTLTYTIGDHNGTIAENAGDLISWTPPLDLATEFPNTEIGTAIVRMNVYNSSGSFLRTELYYQTLVVPNSISPIIANIGLELIDGIDQYALTGKTMIALSPSVDMSNCYGSTLSKIIANITDGSVIYQLTWTSATEGEPGIYTGSVLTSNTLTSSGVATVDITAIDSRGRYSELSTTIPVLEYSTPQIISFDVERYEPVYDENEDITGNIASDLGGYVRVTIEANICSLAPEGVELNTLQWKIYGETITRSSVFAEGNGNQFLSIVNDTTIFPEQVGENESWQYTLILSDTVGSTAIRYSSVSSAHASFSISPDKYGLAIGMIAKGTRNDPRFEVAEGYESYFYGLTRVLGGITGADGYRLDKAVQYEPVEISNSNFIAYNAAYRPRISRVGPLVFLDGMVKNTAELAESFAQNIATLPEWARPAIDVHALHQGSGRALWWLRVGSDGAVSIQRYRNESGYIAAATTSQFPLSLNWIAADAFAYFYSITVILSNCSIDNSSSSIVENSSYRALIMPDSNYHISSVVVTMGDADVSSCYSDGVIHIPNVNGDIVITAIAESIAVQDIVVTDDGNGNLILIDDSGEALDYIYDSDGNMIIKKYGNSVVTIDGGNVVIT